MFGDPEQKTLWHFNGPLKFHAVSAEKGFLGNILNFITSSEARYEAPYSATIQPIGSGHRRFRRDAHCGAFLFHF